MKRPKVLVALATVYLVWGSTYLALRWVVESLPPMLAAGARYLLAGSVLLVLGRIAKKTLPAPRMWLRAAPIGLFMFLVGNGFVSLAEREVSSTEAAIVCATMPLVTVVFGLAWGERPRAREIVGLVLGFGGVVVMTVFELGRSPSAWGSSLLLLFAPLGWGLGSTLSRRWALPGGLAGAALPMIWGGLLALALGFVMGERVPPHVPARAVAPFFYLVVFGSMIAFTAYQYLLRHAPPAIATSYAYVNPVVAMVLGATWGKEPLKASSIVGGLFVVSGVTLLLTTPRPAPQRSQSG